MEDKADFRIAIVIGVSAGVFIAIGNLYWQQERMRTEIVNLRQSIQTEFTKLNEASHQANGNHKSAPEPNKRMLDSLKEDLTEQVTSAKTQATVAALHAKEAVNHADKIAERLGEENQSRHKEVIGELGQLKEMEANASARINDVNTDIAAIKTDVATTQQELHRTVSELKQVTGDLGVQSGYIATNAKQLQALKQLGERIYIDFQIERNGKPQRVGDVSILLKKTDAKRSRYTVEVLANDKRTEKKERSINEPVQFYVSKERIPSEIVVNEVRKDLIVGYLSAPKELIARND